jgi:hypothetical protein
MSAPSKPDPAQRGRAWALAGCAIGAAAWIAAALLMADRGLDTSDEGFYLLSYRWWHGTDRYFTGVQFIYGPVLDLLGGSVAGLRIVRLVSIIAVHATLGWAVVSWLRVRGPEPVLSSSGEIVAVGSITVAGAVQYGWLPLSPGYNDVALLTSLGLAAALFRCMRSVQNGGPLPVLPAVGAGLAATLLIVAKWSSAILVLAVVVVLGVVALRRLNATGWLRFIGVGVATLAGSVAAFVALAGGPSSISTMVGVNRLVAESSNSLGSLFRTYSSSGVEILGLAVLLAVPAAICVVAAWVLHSRGAGRSGSLILLLAPLTVAFSAWPARLGVPIGGSAHVKVYAAALIALAGLVAFAVVVEHRGNAHREIARAPHGMVVLLLLLLPAVQALGTGNALYVMAVNGFGCWVAVMVVVVAEMRGAARPLGQAALAVAVAACTAIGVSGLLEVPYRTSSYADSRTRIGGDGIVAGIRVDPVQAHLLHEVQNAAGDLPPGTPVLAFDEMAGYVLALNGRSVGEAWYSAIDHHRTIVGIRGACADADPFAVRRPVVLFDRPPERAEVTALGNCGVDLDFGYEVTSIEYGAGRSVMVYRPVGTRK